MKKKLCIVVYSACGPVTPVFVDLDQGDDLILMAMGKGLPSENAKRVLARLNFADCREPVLERGPALGINPDGSFRR